MGLNGCCSALKYLMVLVNFLFWILGLAIIICAVWMLTDPTFVFSMTQQNTHYYIALYIFLAVGALMLIVAFLGCCGAFKESQCLLVSFFCCLLVVIVAEIAAGAWAFHNHDKLDEMVKTSVKHTVSNEYGEIYSRTVAFDTFQRQLKCCGADGPLDWGSAKYNNKGDSNILDMTLSNLNILFEVPESCCKEGIDKNVCDVSRKMGLGASINPAINSNGCMEALVKTIHGNWTTLLGITIAVILLEFFGLIFSLVLCCAIKNNDHYKA